MAVTDAYADAATYRAVVTKSDTASDAAILVDLTAVSRYLDRRLGRHFTKDAADVARVVRIPADLPWTPRARYALDPIDGTLIGDAPYAVLPIDDLAAAPTSLIVDEDADGAFSDTAWAITDYELLPLNAALGPEPRPYTAVRIPTWSTKGGWPSGALVQITGRWGWPAVPAAIARATCHLAGMLRLESPRATDRITELDQVVGTSRAARDLLDDLVRQYGRTRVGFA